MTTLVGGLPLQTTKQLLLYFPDKMKPRFELTLLCVAPDVMKAKYNIISHTTPDII